MNLNIDDSEQLISQSVWCLFWVTSWPPVRRSSSLHSEKYWYGWKHTDLSPLKNLRSWPPCTLKEICYCEVSRNSFSVILKKQWPELFLFSVTAPALMVLICYPMTSICFSWWTNTGKEWIGSLISKKCSHVGASILRRSNDMEFVVIT